MVVRQNMSVGIEDRTRTASFAGNRIKKEIPGENRADNIDHAGTDSLIDHDIVFLILGQGIPGGRGEGSDQKGKDKEKERLFKLPENHLDPSENLVFDQMENYHFLPNHSTFFREEFPDSGIPAKTFCLLFS